ncbi:MAG: hypothetical protein RL701_6061, partial [Pseudomonadota bacterium]
RFYFSLRSPYTWLAWRRTRLAAAKAGMQVEYVPVFPPPGMVNDPTKVPAKLEYIRHDVARQARAYGLPCQLPSEVDCEWVRPHAAFLFALDRGRGCEFADAALTARFERGESLGDAAVIACCAEQVGLDAQLVVAAQDELALQERVVLGMIRGATEDGLFGVPLFVLGSERFWGNDRIEWLLRHLAERSGSAVPDLVANPLGPVLTAP